jgi:hypothetical protein
VAQHRRLVGREPLNQKVGDQRGDVQKKRRA